MRSSGWHWLDEHSFWFIDHDSAGDHYRVMTAPGGRDTAAFDQQKLAAALSSAAGKPVAAMKLDITGIRIEGHGRYEITRKGKHFECDLSGAPHCVDEATRVKTGKEPGILSPDRKLDRLHPRLESLGARPRHGQGAAAHLRWGEGLRLCHR